MNEVLLSVSHSIKIFPFVCHAYGFIWSNFDEIDFKFVVFIPALFVQLFLFEPLLLFSTRYFLELNFYLFLERLDQNLTVSAFVWHFGQQLAYILNMVKVKRLQEWDQIIVQFEYWNYIVRHCYSQIEKHFEPCCICVVQSLYPV